MRKLSILSLVFIGLFLFNSCKSYNENEVKVVANNFLNAMHKPVDFKKMKANFNDFPFMSVHRIDEHSIRSIKEIDGEIIADVTTFFINSKDEKFTNDFLFKLKKVKETWKIVDSKGLSNIQSSYPNAYKFSQKSERLNDDLWDIETLIIVKKAKKELKDIEKDLKEMTIQNARANELIKKSDASAAEAQKAFEEFDAKNNKN